MTYPGCLECRIQPGREATRFRELGWNGKGVGRGDWSGDTRLGSIPDNWPGRGWRCFWRDLQSRQKSPVHDQFEARSEGVGPNRDGENIRPPVIVYRVLSRLLDGDRRKAPPITRESQPGSKRKRLVSTKWQASLLLAPVARFASNNALRDGAISSQNKSGSTSGAMRFFWFDGVCH